MRILTSLTAALLLTASYANAQTTITARTATGDGEYRFVEAIHQYPSGVLAGAGYIDAGDPRDYTNTGGQQAFYGGGGYAFNVLGAAVQAIGFIQQNNGPDANDSYTSIVPWVLASRRILGPISATANYLAVAPTDGDVTHVLEHAKAEYDFGRFLAGGGYSGTKTGDAAWDSRPFVTGTIKTPLGDFEVWGQRISADNRSVQLRYLRTF